MNFTDHELALLSDSLYWEMDMHLKAGWRNSPRCKTLQQLQDRIINYLESTGYYTPRKDLG